MGSNRQFVGDIKRRFWIAAKRDEVPAPEVFTGLLQEELGQYGPNCDGYTLSASINLMDKLLKLSALTKDHEALENIRKAAMIGLLLQITAPDSIIWHVDSRIGQPAHTIYGNGKKSIKALIPKIAAEFPSEYNPVLSRFGHAIDTFGRAAITGLSQDDQHRYEDQYKDLCASFPDELKQKFSVGSTRPSDAATTPSNCHIDDPERQIKMLIDALSKFKKDDALRKTQAAQLKGIMEPTVLQCIGDNNLLNGLLQVIEAHKKIKEMYLDEVEALKLRLVSQSVAVSQTKPHNPGVKSAKF